MNTNMTTDEIAALATMESKLDHVRAAVQGVVRDFHTGFFLHGEGGTSKSYTILNELKKLRSAFVYHNTRMTGRGLVDALASAPSRVHVIEDAETMLDDRKAWGVLRSTLWSQSTKRPMDRPVTWTAFKTQINFVFTGGIIVISNQNLSDSVPEVRAIKTRINVLGVDFSGDEIKALMKKICLDGHQFGDDFLSPEECLEVRQFVIDRLSELRRTLDLRIMVNGFRDFLQHKLGFSHIHWHQLLNGRMTERVSYQTRRDANAEKNRVALEIRNMGLPVNEQVRLAKERLGLSGASYYWALKRQ